MNTFIIRLKFEGAPDDIVVRVSDFDDRFAELAKSKRLRAVSLERMKVTEEAECLSTWRTDGPRA